MDNNLKRTHRCTLCNYLAQTYGNSARLFLSKETEFLYVLSNAQSKTPKIPRETRCRVLGKATSSPELEYAAATAVMLAYSKLLDNSIDENSLRSKISLVLMKKQVNKAEKTLKGLGFNPNIYGQQVWMQHSLEKTRKGFPEILAPTQSLLAAIFKHTSIIAGNPSNMDPLSSLGGDLGSLIYTLDGYTDLEEDYIKGQYNPFLVNRTVPEFHPRTEEITHATEQVCDSLIQRIITSSRKIALNRYQETLRYCLSERLTQSVSDTISRGGLPQAPPLYQFIFRAAVIVLKAVIGQEEADGDMYDCFVWCCCEDEDPCICDEPVASTGEPLIDYAIRTVTSGGGAAIAGAGAGIAGGKLLNRGKKEPEEPLVDPVDELIEPDDVRIVEIPDKLPEVPELDKSKIEDSTVDPGYMDNVIHDLGGTSPKKTPELPPDIGKPDYPEDIDDGVAHASGMDHWDVWEWWKKNRSGEARSPETRPAFIDKEDWKSEDEHWVWKKAYDWISEPASSYWNSTKEQLKAASDALKRAGQKMVEMGGAFGGKSEATKALSDPVRYTQTGRGDPKTMLTQALRDRKGKMAIKAMRAYRAIVTFLGSGGSKTFSPRTRIPMNKNVGGGIFKTTEYAKKIGQGTTVIRDYTGAPSGVLDGISQTGDSPYHKTISPDSTAIVEQTGVWQVDLAQQEAILDFESKYGRTPDPNKPLDVEAWRNIVDDNLGGR